MIGPSPSPLTGGKSLTPVSSLGAALTPLPSTYHCRSLMGWEMKCSAPGHLRQEDGGADTPLPARWAVCKLHRHSSVRQEENDFFPPCRT